MSAELLFRRIERSLSFVRISAPLDFFFPAPRSRNKVKRAGLTRTITITVEIRGTRLARTDIFFYLFPSPVGSPSPPLSPTNFFSLTLVLLFLSQPPSRQSLHRCHCPTRLPYSSSSIDLFRDPRLLLEIDSDISAPGGLLKLHTFLGGNVVFSRSPRPACASLFAFLNYISFPS